MDLMTGLIVAATNGLIAIGGWAAAQNSKRGRLLRLYRRTLDDAVEALYATRKIAMRNGVPQADLPPIDHIEGALDDA